MSNMSGNKRKNPKTLSEKKTLPIQSQDGRAQATNAAWQDDDNVERMKRWGEEHQC